MRPFFSFRCCSDVTWSQRPPVISPWEATAVPARTLRAPRCLSSLAPVFPSPCPWNVAQGGREVREPGQRGLEGRSCGVCAHTEREEIHSGILSSLLVPTSQDHFLSLLPVLLPYLPPSPFAPLWALLRPITGETSSSEEMRVQTWTTEVN